MSSLGQLKIRIGCTKNYIVRKLSWQQKIFQNPYLKVNLRIGFEKSFKTGFLKIRRYWRNTIRSQSVRLLIFAIDERWEYHNLKISRVWPSISVFIGFRKFAITFCVSRNRFHVLEIKAPKPDFSKLVFNGCIKKTRLSILVKTLLLLFLFSTLYGLFG